MGGPRRVGETERHPEIIMQKKFGRVHQVESFKSRHSSLCDFDLNPKTFQLQMTEIPVISSWFGLIFSKLHFVQRLGIASLPVHCRSHHGTAFEMLHGWWYNGSGERLRELLDLELQDNSVDWDENFVFFSVFSASCQLFWFPFLEKMSPLRSATYSPSPTVVTSEHCVLICSQKENQKPKTPEVTRTGRRTFSYCLHWCFWNHLQPRGVLFILKVRYQRSNKYCVCGLFTRDGFGIFCWFPQDVITQFTWTLTKTRSVFTLEEKARDLSKTKCRARFVDTGDLYHLKWSDLWMVLCGSLFWISAARGEIRGQRRPC